MLGVKISNLTSSIRILLKQIFKPEREGFSLNAALKLLIQYGKNLKQLNCSSNFSLFYTLFYKHRVFKVSLSILDLSLFYAYNMLSKIENVVTVPRSKRSLH